MKLSPSAGLFLLFAHPTHPLANHALHKRMESGQQLAEGRELTFNTPHNTLASSERTASPIPLPEHQSFSFNARPYHSGQSSNHDPFGLPGHFPPQTSAFGSSNKLSHHDQRLGHEIISIIASSRRFFPPISNFEEAFGQLPPSKYITEASIQEIINQTPMKYLKFDDGMTFDKLIMRTTDNLHRLIDFLTKKVPEINEQLESNKAVINSHLVEITKSDPDHSIRQHAVTQASHYASRLQKEEEILARYLKDFPHLSSLHGILGPANLFSDPFKVLLRIAKDRLRLPSQFDPDKFVELLDTLLKSFSSVLSSHNHFHTVYLHELRHPLFSQEEFFDGITEFEVGRNALFKDKESFLQLIDRIKQSDLYQSLQSDLEAPQDLVGYELALINPLEVGIKSNRQRSRFPPGKLGNSHSRRTASTFKKISSLALDNMHLRISTARNALRLLEEFSQSFSSQGLHDLGTRLQKLNEFGRPNKVRKLHHLDGATTPR